MDKQQNNQPQDGENGSNGKFPKNQFYIVLIAVFITFAIAAFMRSYMIDKSQKEIPYDEFVSQLETETLRQSPSATPRLIFSIRKTPGSITQS